LVYFYIIYIIMFSLSTVLSKSTVPNIENSVTVCFPKQNNYSYSTLNVIRCLSRKTEKEETCRHFSSDAKIKFMTSQVNVVQRRNFVV